MLPMILAMALTSQCPNGQCYRTIQVPQYYFQQQPAPNYYVQTQVASQTLPAQVQPIRPEPKRVEVPVQSNPEPSKVVEIPPAPEATALIDFVRQKKPPNLRLY